jgi:hypothetical protein
MTATKVERTLRVLCECKTADGRPIVGITIAEGKKVDGYYLWLSDESDDMTRVYEWKKETQVGRFQQTYRVIVTGVGNRAVSCNCEHHSKRGMGAKPCRHRAGTEKLIQLGKL